MPYLTGGKPEAEPPV